MIFKKEIENGTVNPALPDYAVKYSISTSDIYDTIPGSVTYQNFDEGAQILSIDLSSLSVYIEKDWTNRKSLANQNSIIVKKGNIVRKFNFTKIFPATVNSQPATRIILSTSTTAQDLFDFIGTTGALSASGTAFLGLYPQNDYSYNDLSYDFEIQKNVESHEMEEFYVDFSWKNNYNVNKNTLRWRTVPTLVRTTDVLYSIIDGGEYTKLPNAFVNSPYGAGETVELSGSVKNITVIDGGLFDGTPYLVAIYPGGSGATFSVGMSGNSISSASVVYGGLGYNESPNIVAVGATVLSAPTFSSTVEIAAVNRLTFGYDYVSSPTVTLSGGSGASGSIGATVSVINEGRVDYTKVISGGINYVTGQEVVFTGGSGSGAKGTVYAENGSIVSVKMTDYGKNYSSAPSAAIVGGGSGAVLQPIVSPYEDWNYVEIDPDNPGYTINNMKKYLEYEWQVYSGTEKRENFTNYTQPLRFKFF